MKKTIVASALLALFATSAFAQDAAPASPHSVTGNVTLASEYIYRGIGQTNREPAIQGGFDYAHSSGFYLGTWASS
ncbi:MAG: TorF family putative porin, partial [Proteobacteria bacterium]|nr:TorF family putative porin [Pseudomonadota bacterium]